jgi:hypothetical protein
MAVCKFSLVREQIVQQRKNAVVGRGYKLKHINRWPDEILYQVLAEGIKISWFQG